MKTMIPDIIIETIVGPVISCEYTKIKITKNTHSKAINPICIGVSFLRAINFCLFNLVANIQKRDLTKQSFHLFGV